MTLWHGYEQHPDAHPERPWWRYHKEGWRLCWRRSDGIECRFALGYRFDAKDADGDRIGNYTMAEWDAAQSRALAATDRAHPIPAPEPRCGQVWATADGSFTSMITSTFTNIEGTRTVWCDDWHLFWPKGDEPDAIAFPTNWPPPHAVLVVGPGAPWAPPEGA